ncbi:MAG: hypothetical protein K2I53_01665 [Lachnospiraceae bacterium]|nr:hypothetical protein [Lachnospiraceae bacterium]
MPEVAALVSRATDQQDDGYVYVTGDLKPEVRAKIEAKVRAEQAAKISGTC